jgi:hypothetical protein
MERAFRDAVPAVSGDGGRRLAGCVPDYVRYKPGVSCVIGYRLSFVGADGERAEQRAYGRLLGPDEGDEAWEKAQKTHTATPAIGPPAVRLHDLGMIVSFFPNDRRLRRLRYALDPKKLKRVVMREVGAIAPPPWWVSGKRTRLEILSYKPERHCVVRCRLGVWNRETGEVRRVDLFAKLLRPEEGSHVYGVNRRIRRASEDGCGPRIPEPLGFDRDLNIFFQEEVDGRSPLDFPAGSDGWDEMLAGIAGQLRALHRTDAGDLRDVPVEAMFHELAVSAEAAAGVIPARAGALSGLVGELGGSIPSGRPMVPVHGDFHFEQVRVGADGPVLLDLDALHRSDPMEDVANFTAHLLKYRMAGAIPAGAVEGAEASFLEGYFRGESRSDHESACLWHRKAAFVRLALSSLKYLEPGWSERFDAYLEAAARAKPA